MNRVISTLNTIAISCALAAVFFLDDSPALGITLMLISWDMVFRYFSGDFMYAKYTKLYKYSTARKLTLFSAAFFFSFGLFISLHYT